MAHAAGRGKGTGANMAASLARPHTGPEPAFGHTAPASHQFRAGGAQVLPAIQGAPNEPRPRKGIGESNEAEDDDTDDFGVATAAISGNGEEGGVDVADANGEPDEAMPLYKGTSEEEASLSSSAVGASGSPAQPQPPLADSKTPPHWATMDYRGVGNDEKDGDVSVEPAAGIGGDGSGADGPQPKLCSAPQALHDYRVHRSHDLVRLVLDSFERDHGQPRGSGSAVLCRVRAGGRIELRTDPRADALEHVARANSHDQLLDVAKVWRRNTQIEVLRELLLDDRHDDGGRLRRHLGLKARRNDFCYFHADGGSDRVRFYYRNRHEHCRDV